MTTQKPSEGEHLVKLLKNEAKMLRKSVKAGEQEALHRVALYFKAPENSTLQQAQLVVAREHGLASWKKLTARARTQRQSATIDFRLDEILRAAFKAAAKKRYRVFTVEHALLALLGVSDVVDALSYVGCDVDLLSRELVTFIENTSSRFPPDSEQTTQPAIEFERVMQTAVWHKQFAEKDVTPINVLISIFSQDSTAASLLKQQHITRMSIVDYLVSR